MISSSLCGGKSFDFESIDFDLEINYCTLNIAGMETLCNVPGLTAALKIYVLSIA